MQYLVEVGQSKMQINKLGAVGEFIGSFVVAVSLVVLIFQIRQNSNSLNENKRVAMAQTHQARTDFQVEVDRILQEAS